MLTLLMIVCAGGAIFLIGLGAYSELKDLWVHPMKHGEEHPEIPPHPR